MICGAIASFVGSTPMEKRMRREHGAEDIKKYQGEYELISSEYQGKFHVNVIKGTYYIGGRIWKDKVSSLDYRNIFEIDFQPAELNGGWKRNSTLWSVISTKCEFNKNILRWFNNDTQGKRVLRVNFNKFPEIEVDWKSSDDTASRKFRFKYRGFYRN